MGMARGRFQKCCQDREVLVPVWRLQCTGVEDPQENGDGVTLWQRESVMSEREVSSTRAKEAGRSVFPLAS